MYYIMFITLTSVLTLYVAACAARKYRYSLGIFLGGAACIVVYAIMYLQEQKVDHMHMMHLGCFVFIAMLM